MTTLYNRSQLRSYRKALRHHMTKSEAVLWQQLKGSEIGYKFRRQHSIRNYILDFYCPSVRLAIEIDGYTHTYSDQRKKDEQRDQYLQTLYITVIRFSDAQILDTLSDVIHVIRTTCDSLTPHHPAPSTRGTPPYQGGDN